MLQYTLYHNVAGLFMACNNTTPDELVIHTMYNVDILEQAGIIPTQ